MFTDHAKIYVKAGDGGAGALSFRPPDARRFPSRYALGLRGERPIRSPPYDPTVKSPGIHRTADDS